MNHEAKAGPHRPAEAMSADELAATAGGTVEEYVCPHCHTSFGQNKPEWWFHKRGCGNLSSSDRLQWMTGGG